MKTQMLSAGEFLININHVVYVRASKVTVSNEQVTSVLIATTAITLTGSSQSPIRYPSSQVISLLGNAADDFLEALNELEENSTDETSKV